MKRRLHISLLFCSFLLMSCRPTSSEEVIPPFQVSLESEVPNISLSLNSDFSSIFDSFIVDTLPPFNEYTYGEFVKNDLFDSIDNETTSSMMGGNLSFDGRIESLNFYKCTFFIKNTSKIVVDYDLKIKITEIKTNEGTQALDETIRFGVFEDGELTVLAKKSETPHRGEDGQDDYRQPISIPEEEATEANPFYGYAEMFESEDVITTRHYAHFEPDEMFRYTILFWLEGYASDPTVPFPEGNYIKFGVSIIDREAN